MLTYIFEVLVPCVHGLCPPYFLVEVWLLGVEQWNTPDEWHCCRHYAIFFHCARGNQRLRLGYGVLSLLILVDIRLTSLSIILAISLRAVTFWYRHVHIAWLAGLWALQPWWILTLKLRLLWGLNSQLLFDCFFIWRLLWGRSVIFTFWWRSLLSWLFRFLIWVFVHQVVNQRPVYIFIGIVLLHTAECYVCFWLSSHGSQSAGLINFEIGHSLLHFTCLWSNDLFRRRLDPRWLHFLLILVIKCIISFGFHMPRRGLLLLPGSRLANLRKWVHSLIFHGRFIVILVARWLIIRELGHVLYLIEL